MPLLSDCCFIIRFAVQKFGKPLVPLSLYNQAALLPIIGKPRIQTGNATFDRFRRTGSLYMDKTGLLVSLCNSILGETADIHLYTRPTRFGKTLMLSTIDRFFNVAYRGQTDVFEGLDISKHHEYDSLKNIYPVIRLDMNLLDTADERKLYDSLRTVASKAHYTVEQTYGDGWMSERTKSRFDDVIDERISDSAAVESISRLSIILATELRDAEGNRVGTMPIVLMDEYDAFLQKMMGASPDRYKVITSIVADFSVATFKTNSNLTLGVITGILTLSQTGIISAAPASTPTW